MTFKDKITEIAGQLPGFVTLESCHDKHVSLKDGDGHEICFLLDYKNRIKIRGAYPKYKNCEVLPDNYCYYSSYCQKPPKISVAYNRSSKAIANDINKRFLGEYLDCFAKALKKAIQYENRDLGIMSKMAEIKSLYNARSSQHSDNNQLLYFDTSCGVSGEIESYDAQSFKVTLSAVSFEIVRALCYFIRASEDTR